MSYYDREDTRDPYEMAADDAAERGHAGPGTLDYELVRLDEATGAESKFDLLVDWYIEPTEMEGPYVASQGGVFIEAVTDKATGQPFVLTDAEEEEVFRHLAYLGLRVPVEQYGHDWW